MTYTHNNTCFRQNSSSLWAEFFPYVRRRHRTATHELPGSSLHRPGEDCTDPASLRVVTVIREGEIFRQIGSFIHFFMDLLKLISELIYQRETKSVWYAHLFPNAYTDSEWAGTKQGVRNAIEVYGVHGSNPVTWPITAAAQGLHGTLVRYTGTLVSIITSKPHIRPCL